MSAKKEEKKDYPVTPQGIHVKNAVDERIVILNGFPTYEKWAFLREDYLCGMCNKATDIVFMRLPTGVYRSCEWCGFTEIAEPMDQDTNEPRARLIERKQISVEEAWDVLIRNKAVKFAPVGLPKPVRKRATDESLEKVEFGKK